MSHRGCTEQHAVQRGPLTAHTTNIFPDCGSLFSPSHLDAIEMMFDLTKQFAYLHASHMATWVLVIHMKVLGDMTSPENIRHAPLSSPSGIWILRITSIMRQLPQPQLISGVLIGEGLPGQYPQATNTLTFFLQRASKPSAQPPTSPAYHDNRPDNPCFLLTIARIINLGPCKIAVALDKLHTYLLE